MQLAKIKKGCCPYTLLIVVAAGSTILRVAVCNSEIIARTRCGVIFGFATLLLPRYQYLV